MRLSHALVLIIACAAFFSQGHFCAQPIALNVSYYSAVSGDCYDVDCRGDEYSRA